MDQIHFRCPRNHPLRADVSVAGKTMRCPAEGCGVSVTVPPAAAKASDASVLGDVDCAALDDQGRDGRAPVVAPPGSRWDALLTYARPNLYRKNPFRILGLSTEATEGEARRQIEQYLRVRATMPLDLSEAGLREALGALRQPETRLLAECFWYWPLPPGGAADDPALRCLSVQDIAGAEMAWREAQGRRQQVGVASHNLAILHHRRAVELELIAEEHPLGRDELPGLAGHWREAYRHWRKVLVEDHFWPCFSRRVKELGGDHFPADLTDRCRETLPIALVSLHGHLLLSRAGLGKAAEARRHVEILRASGLGEAALREGLRQGVEKAMGKVATFAANARAEAGADPVHADEAFEQLLARVEAYLPILKLAGPEEEDKEDRPMRFADAPSAERAEVQTAEETVVRQAMGCVGAYGTKTEDWDRCLAMLQRLREVEVGYSTGQALGQMVGRIEATRDAGDGWCVRGYYELEPATLKVLERARAQAADGDWEGAIERLEHLRVAGKSQLGENWSDDPVDKPLAYCLHNSMSSLLRQIEERVEDPLKLFSHLTKADLATYARQVRRLNRALERMQRVEKMSLLEMFTCGHRPTDEGWVPPPCAGKSCVEEQFIIGTIYVARWRGYSVPLCRGCAKRLIEEEADYFTWLEERRKKVMDVLKQAYELAPKNGVIRQKVERLAKAAQRRPTQTR